MVYFFTLSSWCYCETENADIAFFHIKLILPAKTTKRIEFITHSPLHHLSFAERSTVSTIRDVSEIASQLLIIFIHHRMADTDSV